MTVKSYYAIVNAMLSDWLKKSSAIFSTNKNQNQSHPARVIFPALGASYIQLVEFWLVQALFSPIVIGRSNFFDIGLSTVICFEN